VVGIEWSTDRISGLPGTATHGAGGSEDGIPFAPGVDKPAIARAGNPSPRYPEVLRRANVAGEVVVQVVVDTTGLADLSTLRVLSSAHPLLTDAVLATFPRARFIPAETGGRKVRMWVVQSFVFEMK
jgi:protein TonB